MAWELNGNSDATATSFLGPTNAQPLIVKTAPTAGATPLERLRVTTEGRVGIGIIKPEARLTVAAGGAIINNVAIGTNGLSVDYPEEQETLGLATPGTSAVLRLQSPNGLTFHTGTPGFTAADNLRMTITASGEVGVGKTPATNYKLDVAGTVNATDIHKNGAPLSVSQWDDVAGGITYGGGGVGIGKAPSTSYKLDVAGAINATSIRKNGSPVVSSQWKGVTGGINYAAGNVGVGKAPAANYKLDVAGTINATDYHKNGSALISSQWTDVSGGISYAGGNVGIGTTDSRHGRLTIEDDEVPLALRESGHSPSAGGLWRVALDGGALRFDANTAAGGDFSSFATPLAMSPSGNVGIGTPTPGAGAKLTVAGGDITWGNNSRLACDQGGSIELGGDSDTPGTGTPYIDFHFSGVTQDFNTRIINDANGQLTISAGTLRTLGDVAITGRATVGAGVAGTSNTGFGVEGISTSAGGVVGKSDSGTGVGARSESAAGVLGVSRFDDGVVGINLEATGDIPPSGVKGLGGPDGIGVTGISGGPNPGVRGTSSSGTGVSGTTSSDFASGVRGFSFSSGIAVSGRAAPNSGKAGVFDGGITVVNGNIPFKIDHPLDPQNKYLLHNAVEAPEMKNVYDGVAQLDEDGAAWVELPEWFEALNGDFRYQLTPVGGSAPNLHVAEEVSENRFQIAGGEGGMKVCWQVTGSRKDPWAAAYPFELEQEKPQEERGRFLEPSLYDAPEEQRVMIGAIQEAVEEEHRRLIDELRRQEEEQRPELEELRQRMEGQQEDAPPEST